MAHRRNNALDYQFFEMGMETAGLPHFNSISSSNESIGAIQALNDTENNNNVASSSRDIANILTDDSHSQPSSPIKLNKLVKIQLESGTIICVYVFNVPESDDKVFLDPTSGKFYYSIGGQLVDQDMEKGIIQYAEVQSKLTQITKAHSEIKAHLLQMENKPLERMYTELQIMIANHTLNSKDITTEFMVSQTEWAKLYRLNDSIKTANDTVRLSQTTVQTMTSSPFAFVAVSIGSLFGYIFANNCFSGLLKSIFKACLPCLDNGEPEPNQQVQGYQRIEAHEHHE